MRRAITDTGSGKKVADTNPVSEHAVQIPKKPASPNSPSPTRADALRRMARLRTDKLPHARMPCEHPALDEGERHSRQPSEKADGSHADKDHAGINTLLSFIENMSQAIKRPDQFGSDQRRPRRLQRQTQAGEDRRQRGRNNYSPQ